MFERGITDLDVQAIIEAGELVEDYPDDTPYPSRLLLGWVEDRPIHVVVAEGSDETVTIVVTVYAPDPELWEADLKTRRPRP